MAKLQNLPSVSSCGVVLVCGLRYRVRHLHRRAVRPACDDAIAGRRSTFILDFVKSSGSLKEMARKLGLSYPTVRNRLDDIIAQIQTIENNETNH
ncbi:MAG: DUF2089 family protein [Alistipes sp.]